MRLFEAILEANHRALAGDSQAGVHPSEFASELPVVGLTCIDPRLNRLFPGVLGLPEEQFIWLRNAGNIITSPLSSTMRSLALACAVKGGREIVIIGHTDCRIRQATIASIIDRFKALGIDRASLPENLSDFFGVSPSEQQTVLRSVDYVRSSPLIGAAVPVHGLMVDIGSGKLDWVVNGYDVLERRAAAPPPGMKPPGIGRALEELSAMASFNIGEMKFPEGKIGNIVADLKDRFAPQEAPKPVATPPPLTIKHNLPPPRPSAPIPLPPNIPRRKA